MFKSFGLLLLLLRSLVAAGVLCIGETGLSVVHAQTGGTSVAIVDGKSISEEEVDNSVIYQLLSLRQQMYAIRKIALDNLITRTILENEAGRRGVTVEALKRQLTAARVDIPASRVEQVYLENAAAFGSMSADEARERIRLDLESQARMRNYREALAKLREGSSVRILLKEPRLSPGAVAEDASPSTGATQPAVIITEFSDFQCSYCKQAHGTIKQILRDYPKDVKLIFKHLPLAIHPQAFAAAQAAFCAGEQNSFWQYHDALFDSEHVSPETFAQIAQRLGLNPSKFKDCLASDTSRSAVLRDVREARRLGIDGTPAFIVNGKLIRSALSFEDFKAVIESELKSSAAAPRQ